MHQAVGRALGGFLLVLLSGPLAADLNEVEQLLEAESYQQALEKLELLPESPRSPLLRAITLTKLKREKEAEALYRRLIAESPDDPVPYNNLASLYAATGRLQEASELLTQAMRSDPRYATIYKNLSRVYVEMSSQSYAMALRLSQPQQGLQLSRLDYRDAAGMSPQLAAATPPASLPEAQVVPARLLAAVPVAPVDPVTPVTPAVDLIAPVGGMVAATAETPARSSFDGGGAIAALKRWAAAWSAQDVEGYLGVYDAEYLPPRGLSLAQWQAERRVRLLKPGTIEVGLSDFEVSSGGGGSVTVKAVQRYRSDNYRDRTRKGFVLVPRDGGWKIGDEYTIEVLN